MTRTEAVTEVTQTFGRSILAGKADTLGEFRYQEFHLVHAISSLPQAVWMKHSYFIHREFTSSSYSSVFQCDPMLRPRWLGR